jgi:hypothetical protein
MTFDQLPAYLQTKIVADSTLAALGTPIIVDPFLDPQAAQAALALQLRTTGVAIEVGFPYLGAPETLLGGATHVDATVEVFVAEHVTKAHTPNKLSLVMKVVAACCKNPGGGAKPARLRSAESVKTESGYILHMLSFFVPMNVK